MSRWYKRYGGDFIHGTMMLSLEEKGAYSLCLDLIYDRGGPIPDDPRWLSGVCGVSIRKWKSIRDRLISLGKLSEENGFLINFRAHLELVSTELQRRNQAETGAKGGRKRVENEARAKENKHLSQGTLKPNRGEERRIEEIPLAKANGRDAPFDDFVDPEKQFWDDAKAYLRRHVKSDPGALIGKWCRSHQKEKTRAAIHAAQVERAVDPVAYIEGFLRRNSGPDLSDRPGYRDKSHPNWGPGDPGHSGIPI